MSRPVFLENDSDEFAIVTVQSGVRSLRSQRFGETFHPVVGPMAEAEHRELGDDEEEVLVLQVLGDAVDRAAVGQVGALP